MYTFVILVPRSHNVIYPDSTRINQSGLFFWKCDHLNPGEPGLKLPLSLGRVNVGRTRNSSLIL